MEVWWGGHRHPALKVLNAENPESWNEVRSKGRRRRKFNSSFIAGNCILQFFGYWQGHFKVLVDVSWIRAVALYIYSSCFPANKPSKKILISFHLQIDWVTYLVAYGTYQLHYPICTVIVLKIRNLLTYYENDESLTITAIWCVNIVLAGEMTPFY